MRVLVGFVVGLLAGAASADLHVISEVDTGATGKIIVEQWITDEVSYRRQGQIVYLADLKKNQLLMIDHQRRRVTEFELLDPKPLGAFQFEITTTGNRGTVGKWPAEEYQVLVAGQPGLEYRVWATREIQAQTQHYFNFVRRLPSGDALAASLAQLDGFPVRIVSRLPGGQEIVSEVIKIENATPPGGIYRAPKGYKVEAG